jgi:hypothetical protein
MAQHITQPVDLQIRSGHSLYRRDGLLCAFLMAACLLLAHPFVEMGFIDDWSYVKTTQVFFQTGRFTYNGWATVALGWQVPWGALFSKLFGFSFVHVRLSTLPVAVASVYVFHQILVRFGISRGNAIFGTLTLALSPIFMAMSASYMTDVTGLFCTLLCLYLCQHALSAPTDRGALAWLCLAAVSNIAGGTVRQTAWLGVLLIVPSTAWLLRQRRGVVWGGALLWLTGVACVFACMQWLNHQPYFLPQGILPERFTLAALKPVVLREVLWAVKVFCCVLLLVFPILASWLPLVRSVPRRPLLWISLISSVLLTGFLVYSDRRGHLDSWIAPWLIHVINSMGYNGGDIPGPSPGPLQNTGLRIIVTVSVLGSALIFFLHLFSRLRMRARASQASTLHWSQMVWLLVPWTLGYIGALVIQGFIFDRYLLTLQVVAIIFLLRYYQDFAAPDGKQMHPRFSISSFPITSQVALLVFAYFAVAGTHDWFAVGRARLEAVEEVRRSGVPRTAIQAGFEYDSWTQLEVGGYINDSRIRIPKEAYQPLPVLRDPRPDCAVTWYPFTLTPVVIAKYFVAHAPLTCLAPSPFPPVTYYGWMPPFTRHVYVYQRKE